ncbi:hypothetical protein [Nonomuraea jabiensis]
MAGCAAHGDVEVGRLGGPLKNDGTTELDIHATTSSGDITARSL